jgi:hypothetical protein
MARGRSATRRGRTSPTPPQLAAAATGSAQPQPAYRPRRLRDVAKAYVQMRRVTPPGDRTRSLSPTPLLWSLFCLPKPLPSNPPLKTLDEVKRMGLGDAEIEYARWLLNDEPAKAKTVPALSNYPLRVKYVHRTKHIVVSLPQIIKFQDSMLHSRC